MQRVFKHPKRIDHMKKLIFAVLLATAGAAVMADTTFPIGGGPIVTPQGCGIKNGGDGGDPDWCKQK